MNLVHLHLLLNHVPTVGTIIAFGVLLLAGREHDTHNENCQWFHFGGKNTQKEDSGKRLKQCTYVCLTADTITNQWL